MDAAGGLAPIQAGWSRASVLGGQGKIIEVESLYYVYFASIVFIEPFHDNGCLVYHGLNFSFFPFSQEDGKMKYIEYREMYAKNCDPNQDLLSPHKVSSETNSILYLVEKICIEIIACTHQL